MKYITCLLLVCAGCSTFTIDQVEIAQDGTKKETHIRGHTFWDSKNELHKMRTTSTDKSQGVSIGSVGQESSASNVVTAIKITFEGLANGAVKAIVP